MECQGISEGIQTLCLTQNEPDSLGAIPKVTPRSEQPRKQTRKKNRKDRRRTEAEAESNRPISKVERLRAEGLHRSKIEIPQDIPSFPFVSLDNGLLSL